MAPHLVESYLWSRGLLDDLRRSGFEIGVREYLAVARLVRATGGAEPREVLGRLVGSIVVRDPDTRERFDEVLAANLIVASPPPPPPPPPTPPPLLSPWQELAARVGRWISTAVFLLVVGGIVVKIVTPSKPVPGPGPDPTPDTTSGTGAGRTVPAGLVAPRLIAPEQFADPGDRSAVNLGRLALAALPFLAWIGVGVWSRQRRRAVAQRVPDAKPPFAWTIKVPNVGLQLLGGLHLQAAARALRRRQRASTTQIALEPTIRSTMKNAGFLSLVEEPVTRPAEYLVLIERQAPRDHLAHYYRTLFRRLSSEGVYCSEYFFQHDPRVCRDPETLATVPLAELLRRRGNDRLLVVSDGGGLCHPVTGRVQPWIHFLEPWADRALLSPIPPSWWGPREDVLGDHLFVLPGTLEGIRAAVDHFDTGTRPDPSRWASRDRSLDPLPAGRTTGASELQAALHNETLLRWLGACTVYGELHWDLTARLARLPGFDPAAFSEANLLRLFQLECFRQGMMRKELAVELRAAVRELDQRTGGRTEMEARLVINGLIDANPVDAEAFAARGQQRERLKNELLIYADAPSGGGRPPPIDLSDVTVARLVENADPNDLQLPDWLRDALDKAQLRKRGLGWAGAAYATIYAATVLQVIGQHPTLAPSASGMTRDARVIIPNLGAIVGRAPRLVPLRVRVVDTATGAPIAGPLRFSSSDPTVATVRAIPPSSCCNQGKPLSRSVPVRPARGSSFTLRPTLANRVALRSSALRFSSNRAGPRSSTYPMGEPAPGPSRSARVTPGCALR